MSVNLLESIQEQLAYTSSSPMLFNSGVFFVLFILFLPLYYLLRNKQRARILYVIAFSLFFYYKSSGFYALLLLITSCLDFSIGGVMHRVSTQWKRKFLLVCSLCFNLGLLGYFKYTHFLLDSFTPLLELLGFLEKNGEPLMLDIFLPVGISFFTFQSMSYTIDIYRRTIEPLKRYTDYLFYISFFPQLVAGPIVRAKEFIPQIYKSPRVTREEFGEGLYLIIAGLIKKVIISDYISLNFVDRVFDAPTLYTGFENLIASYGYALQIYCDFSGYSDMAIGIALWLGFRFNINFASPYRSATITEFWRRWHISLSSWLKDYLYVSLGGNRKGRIRTYINLILTMLLGGLWHGAHIRFILWGALHGVALATHKMLASLSGWVKKEGAEMSFFTRILSTLITFHFVVFAWLPFRAESLSDVGEMLDRMIHNFHPEVITQFVDGYQMVTFLLLLGYGIHFIPSRIKESFQRLIQRLPLLLQALLLALVILLVVQFRSVGVQPFIYFQF